MLAWSGWAEAAKLQIESPAFSFDAERNRYRYEGARVEFRELILEADVVEIDPDAALIEATGRVRFQDKTVTGSAERLEIITDTGVATLHRAEVYDAKTGYFLRAEKAVRAAPDLYQGTDCELTNCRPGEPGWHIASGSLDYRLDSYALGYNSVLWVGPAPVFWTPLLGWPTVEKRRSGFLAPSIAGSFASRSRFNLGASLRVPYFLALDFDHDLTITPEYFAQRGTGVTLEYNYAFQKDQRGQLLAFGIAETQRRNFNEENVIAGVDPNEEDRTPARYWLRFGHNQRFGESTQLVGRLDESSDGQVLREYEQIRDYRPALDYQASLSEQGNWGNGAITAAHTSEYTQQSLFANGDEFTNGKERPQLLPRLVYYGGWQAAPAWPLGLGLAGTATRFVTEAGVSGQAYTGTPALSYPVRLFGSAEFRPTVQRRFVQYSMLDVADSVFLQTPDQRQAWLTDAESLGSEQDFAQTELNLELRMPMARRFAWEGGSSRSLKHRVTPRLLYRELEDVPQPLAGLLLQPEPALKLVTLRLDNELYGLPPGSASPIWSGSVNLVQRYNLLVEDKHFTPEGPPLPSPGETAPGEPLLPLILELTYTRSGVALGGQLHYHHQLERIVEYQASMSGSVSPRGTLAVSYTDNEFTYRTPENRLHSAGTSMGLSALLAQSDTVSYDFSGVVNLNEGAVPLDRRLSSAQIGLDYHPNCYGIRLSYIEAVDATRDFNRNTGQTETLYFIDRRILLTFNLGGVVSPTGELLLSPRP
jgi:hypothetical protein